MVRVDVRRTLDAHEVDAVSALIDAATVVDGHSPVDEHTWVDLVHGGRRVHAALVAWDASHPHPVGFAQLTGGGHDWALEYVVDPHHRLPDSTVGRDLVERGLAEVAAGGGGHVHLWVNKPTARHDALAAAVGLRRGRDLYQMRRALPAGIPFELTTRPFVPGDDDAAWLEVNNRAFAWHPEQGEWSAETLTARQVEAWFDPEGFLLHEIDGRLAGFCWTKVHDDHDPPLGEIYVIAVDPDFAGRGLGRALTLAGLDHLASRELRHGMLYVDSTNATAVRLYVSLGFAVDHVDRAYVGDVTPTTEPIP